MCWYCCCVGIVVGGVGVVVVGIGVSVVVVVVVVLVLLLLLLVVSPSRRQQHLYRGGASAPLGPHKRRRNHLAACRGGEREREGGKGGEGGRVGGSVRGG